MLTEAEPEAISSKAAVPSQLQGIISPLELSNAPPERVVLQWESHMPGLNDHHMPQNARLKNAPTCTLATALNAWHVDAAAMTSFRSRKLNTWNETSSGRASNAA